MSTTVQLIDEIFDEEIRQLGELKRMASNPRLVELMRRIVSAHDGKSREGMETRKVSDNPTFATRKAEPQNVVVDSSTGNGPNGLSKVLYKTVHDFGLTFTIATLVERMLGDGFRFTAKNPKVAVAGPLELLVKKGKVRKVRAGIGSEPNIYEFVGQEPGDFRLENPESPQKVLP
jgi:hypothetical protein